MRISLGAIQTLLEQSSKKVVLSADRGDYQDVMKGDPFDYELDVEEDIFTVSGLNSKREKLSDEKVAKLEKGIGSKFDSGTQPYKTLKKRMSDANLPPEKALKDPNSPQKLDKGTKLSLEYLKTSSVDGKKINGPMVALALSTMSEADLKKLVAVADDVNKYSSVVQGITGGMYTKYNEVINGLDVAFTGVEATAMVAIAAGATGKAGAVAATLAGWPVAVALGIPLAIGSWHAGDYLEQIDESQLEVVLMDIRPMLASVKPKSLRGFASALQTLKTADPEFMEVLPYHGLYKALLPDMWYGLGWAGVQWDDFEDEDRARVIIEKSLKDGTAQQLYDGFMKEMRAKSEKPKDLVDILSTKGGGLEDLAKKVEKAITKKKSSKDDSLLTPKEIEAVLAIVPPKNRA